MGQTSSCAKDFVPDAVDTVQFQITKHTKILSELNNLTLQDLEESLREINELSSRCIDKDGNQMVFAIHNKSNVLNSNFQWSFLWKSTVKIAIVTVHTETRQISNIRMVNLKEFLHIFKTFTTNLEAMSASEEHQRSNNSSPAGCFNPVAMMNDSRFNFESINADEDDSCIICMERKPEVILDCLHSYCTLCIEQWNETGNKSCPVCCRDLHTKDSWVPLDIPEPDEINDEIIQQLEKISHKK